MSNIVSKIYVVLDRNDNTTHIFKGKQKLATFLGCTWNTAHNIVGGLNECGDSVVWKTYEIFTPSTIELSSGRGGYRPKGNGGTYSEWD
jgi:hypothetical protein